MTCLNVVGVKNINLTFQNCETGETFGPYAHELATEELPMWRLYPYSIESLPGGYVKKKHISSKVKLKIIRNLAVPLVDYQGRSQISGQVEYEDGLVYTWVDAGVTGEAESDTHEVDMECSARVIDEVLPPGAIANT